MALAPNNDVFVLIAEGVPDNRTYSVWHEGKDIEGQFWTKSLSGVNGSDKYRMYFNPTELED